MDFDKSIMSSVSWFSATQTYYISPIHLFHTILKIGLKTPIDTNVI